MIVRPVAETTPAVRLARRPSGLPTAKTASPTGGGAAQHRGHDDLREPVDGEHRDVVVGLAGRHLRRRPRAVGELDLDLRGTVDDVQGGEHRAVRVDDHAAAPGPRVPAPCGRSVVTVTSDGVIVW